MQGLSNYKKEKVPMNQLNNSRLCRSQDMPLFFLCFSMQGELPVAGRRHFHKMTDPLNQENRQLYKECAGQWWKQVENLAEDGIIKKNGDTLKMDLQLFAEKDIDKQESSSLKRAIRSYRKQIKEHEMKIFYPEKYIDGWDSLDLRKKNGLKKHWEKEKRNFEQSIQDRIEELKARGDYDEE